MTKKRDPSIFATPLPKTKAQREAAKHLRARTAHAASLALPPELSRYAISATMSKTRMTALHAQYMQGCHLTGMAFADRFHKTRNQHALAAVTRPDGTMVTNAIWMLSQQGSIPDQLLINAARAIHMHQTAQVPQASRPTHTPPRPQQEINNATDKLLGTHLESGHNNNHEPNDTTGLEQPTGVGQRAGRWEWNDSSGAVEYYPE